MIYVLDVQVKQSKNMKLVIVYHPDLEAIKDRIEQLKQLVKEL